VVVALYFGLRQQARELRNDRIGAVLYAWKVQREIALTAQFLRVLAEEGHGVKFAVYDLGSANALAQRSQKAGLPECLANMDKLKALPSKVGLSLASVASSAQLAVDYVRDAAGAQFQAQRSEVIGKAVDLAKRALPILEFVLHELSVMANEAAGLPAPGARRSPLTKQMRE
jgi:hypothetical protein